MFGEQYLPDNNVRGVKNIHVDLTYKYLYDQKCIYDMTCGHVPKKVPCQNKSVYPFSYCYTHVRKQGLMM